MYIYIFVSSLFLAGFIAKSCVNTFSKPKIVFEDIRLDFSNIHYLKKVELLSYFSKPKNFERLEKMLDKSNGIYDKTVKLLEKEENIKNNYILRKKYYKYLFPFEKEPTIVTTFELNEKEVDSSLGQLNFFMWLFENDYLLHIE
jgi:hypothetical protein|tara:strand:+ start:538 stop:969 length:432 start_codon:yes stop_codon:yes gene_type:complete